MEAIHRSHLSERSAPRFSVKLSLFGCPTNAEGRAGLFYAGRSSPVVCVRHTKRRILTMPRIVCGGCQKTFADTQYFAAHLWAASNGGCEIAFRRRKRKPNDGKDGSAIKPKDRRKLTIEQVERVLKENQEAERRREARQKADYSVFDFHNTDSENEAEKAATESSVTRKRKGTEHPKKGNATVNKSEGLVEGLRKFRQYVEYAQNNHAEMEPEMVAACELMHTMNLEGGSLALYDEVSAWHIRNGKTKHEKCPQISFTHTY